jgi:hypothetical protein
MAVGARSTAGAVAASGARGSDAPKFHPARTNRLSRSQIAALLLIDADADDIR